MNKAKASLHNHTYYSDGIHFPGEIVRYARKNGINILSITDHNEIRGTLKGARIASRYRDMIYFPGVELMFTAEGFLYELLAYFFTTKELKEFFNEYRYHDDFMPTFASVSEVVDLVVAHGGVCVAPHPFGRKGIFRKGRNRDVNVHAIEVVNAFTGEKRNELARLHKDADTDFLKLGAADMHFFLSDISEVYTELSSQNPITKETVWENLIGKERTISFKDRGEEFSSQKIFFQKPLCTLVYTVNHPFVYMHFKIQKTKLKYRQQKQQLFEKIGTKKK